MLSKDGALPAADIISSRRKILEFFHREVKPALCPGEDVTDVAIKRMKYTPGRRCNILYSFNLGEGNCGGEAGRVSTSAIASFARDDDLQDVYMQHYGSPLAGGELAPSAAYLPAYRCLAELFPSDWRLPFLSQTTDVSEMTSILARVATNEGKGEAARPKMGIIRYRPHEACVLQYNVSGAHGRPKVVIGKAYADGHVAGLVWRAINLLHAQTATLGVTTPRPLEFVERWNLVLMERMGGTSMKRILEDATSDKAREVTALAATAVAAYHGLKFEGGEEIRSVQSALEKMRKRAVRLPQVAPVLAEQVDVLMRRIEPLAGESGAVEPSFIHGDCKPSQLLIDGEQVAIVDFDRACLGDPALDIGNFMAQFNKLALKKGHDHLRHLASYFLAEYQARLPSSGLTERARVFQAMSLVRMAIRKFESSPHSYAEKGQSSDHVSLLREAALCLDQL